MVKRQKLFIKTCIESSIIIFISLYLFIYQRNSIKIHKEDKIGSDGTMYTTEFKPNENGYIEFVNEGFENRNIKHTFISYEYFTGNEINDQTKYSKNYFMNLDSDGNIPKTRPYVFLDEAEISRQYPELLDKYYSRYDDDSFMSDEEINSIEEEYNKIAERYTYDVEPELSYIFVKCRFENLLETESILKIANMNLYAYEPDGGNLIQIGFPVYFDRPVEGADEHELWDLVLEPHEVLEGVIGVEIGRLYSKDESPIEINSMYFGYMDLNLYNDYYEGKTDKLPIYSKFLFKLDDLKKEG